MIVDDHPGMRTLIRSFLSSTAQEFVECGSGEEAVATFAAARPDWTIMDVVMPGVDGFAATRRIKAGFPDARILIITQHDNPKLRDLARSAGATGFLSKDDLPQLEGMISGRSGATDGDPLH